MPQINDVRIEEISAIGVPPIRSIFTGPPISLPNSPPVTLTIGTPIVDVPGCVEANLNGPGLIDDDPNGNVVFCDGQVPSFNPINYDPEKDYGDGRLTGPPEAIAPKLDLEGNTKLPQTPQISIPNTSGITIPSCKIDEEYNEQFKRCEKKNNEETIELIEEPAFVEKYLPSANEVTTTVTIAVAASTAAVFGKPLAELLLKIIRPAVKKVVQKAKNKIGVTEEVLSVSERRQLQRDLRK
jgi:hypothetical protein